MTTIINNTGMVGDDDFKLSANSSKPVTVDPGLSREIDELNSEIDAFNANIGSKTEVEYNTLVGKRNELQGRANQYNGAATLPAIKVISEDYTKGKELKDRISAIEAEIDTYNLDEDRNNTEHDALVAKYDKLKNDIIEYNGTQSENNKISTPTKVISEASKTLDTDGEEALKRRFSSIADEIKEWNAKTHDDRTEDAYNALVNKSNAYYSDRETWLNDHEPSGWLLDDANKESEFKVISDDYVTNATKSREALIEEIETLNSDIDVYNVSSSASTSDRDALFSKRSNVESKLTQYNEANPTNTINATLKELDKPAVNTVEFNNLTQRIHIFNRDTDTYNTSLANGTINESKYLELLSTHSDLERSIDNYNERYRKPITTSLLVPVSPNVKKKSLLETDIKNYNSDVKEYNTDEVRTLERYEELTHLKSSLEERIASYQEDDKDTLPPLAELNPSNSVEREAEATKLINTAIKEFNRNVYELMSRVNKGITDITDSNNAVDEINTFLSRLASFQKANPNSKHIPLVSSEYRPDYTDLPKEIYPSHAWKTQGINNILPSERTLDSVLSWTETQIENDKVPNNVEYILKDMATWYTDNFTKATEQPSVANLIISKLQNISKSYNDEDDIKDLFYKGIVLSKVVDYKNTSWAPNVFETWDNKTGYYIPRLPDLNKFIIENRKRVNTSDNVVAAINEYNRKAVLFNKGLAEEGDTITTLSETRQCLADQIEYYKVFANSQYEKVNLSLQQLNEVEGLEALNRDIKAWNNKVKPYNAEDSDSKDKTIYPTLLDEYTALKQRVDLWDTKQPNHPVSARPEKVVQPTESVKEINLLNDIEHYNNDVTTFNNKSAVNRIKQDYDRLSSTREAIAVRMREWNLENPKRAISTELLNPRTDYTETNPQLEARIRDYNLRAESYNAEGSTRTSTLRRELVETRDVLNIDLANWNAGDKHTRIITKVVQELKASVDSNIWDDITDPYTDENKRNLSNEIIQHNANVTTFNSNRDAEAEVYNRLNNDYNKLAARLVDFNNHVAEMDRISLQVKRPNESTLERNQLEKRINAYNGDTTVYNDKNITERLETEHKSLIERRDILNKELTVWNSAHPESVIDKELLAPTNSGINLYDNRITDYNLKAKKFNESIYRFNDDYENLSNIRKALKADIEAFNAGKVIEDQITRSLIPLTDANENNVKADRNQLDNDIILLNKEIQKYNDKDVRTEEERLSLTNRKAAMITRIALFNAGKPDELKVNRPLSDIGVTQDAEYVELLRLIKNYRTDLDTYISNKTDDVYAAMLDRYSLLMSRIDSYNRNNPTRHVSIVTKPLPPRSSATINKVLDAPTVKRYTYEFDPTGKSDRNLIKNERHTITPENRTPQNVIIPGFAPFYRQSLIVTDMLTGLPLIEGIDYTVEWPITDSTNETLGYTPLYMGIQLIDNSITGQFEIQYQTLGGQYALDGVAIAQALANHANDPLNTSYEELIGRPIKLPPLEHVHSIDDFVGFGDLVSAIDRIKDTLVEIGREDRDSHPGYDTLIDEYFRIKDRLESNKALLNDLNDKLDKDLTNAISRVDNSLADFKTEVNGNINTLKNNTNDKTDELKRKVVEDIKNFNDVVNDKLKLIRDNMSSEFSKIKQDIKENDNAHNAKVDKIKRELDKTIADNKVEIENNLNAFKQQTVNNFQQQAAQMEAIRSGLANRITKVEGSINTHTAEINQLKDRLAGDEFVKTTTNQNVHGEKTFFNSIRMRHKNDPSYTGTAYIGFNQTDVHIYNPLSNKYLQIRNNGKLEYDDDEVILKNKHKPHLQSYSYVKTTAPDKNGWTGLEMNRNNEVFKLEIEPESAGKRFKLYRTDGVGAVLFPKEQGDKLVAYRDWTDDNFIKLSNPVTQNGNHSRYGIIPKKDDTLAGIEVRSTTNNNHFWRFEVNRLGQFQLGTNQVNPAGRAIVFPNVENDDYVAYRKWVETNYAQTYPDKSYALITANKSGYGGINIHNSATDKNWRYEVSGDRFKLWGNSGQHAIFFPPDVGNHEVAYRDWVNTRLNEVRTELINRINALQNQINNKVNRNGDTMTGELVVNAIVRANDFYVK